MSCWAMSLQDAHMTFGMSLFRSDGDAGSQVQREVVHGESFSNNPAT